MRHESRNHHLPMFDCPYRESCIVPKLVEVAVEQGIMSDGYCELEHTVLEDEGRTLILNHDRACSLLWSGLKAASGSTSVSWLELDAKLQRIEEAFGAACRCTNALE